MQRKRKYCFCLILGTLCCQLLPAQDSTVIKITDTVGIPSPGSLVTVGEILITGNKKTKRNIILREIPFNTGEKYTLEALVKKFEDARRQLMNTALFHSVLVAAKSVELNNVIVSVDLKERWYLFPVPYLKPIDRNLNQWIVEQKASINRVNFGARLTYYNATGRNDKLKATIGVGYTQKFSLSYDRLYIDKKLKWGTTFGFSAGKNKEVNYNTIKDKQVFVKDNDNFLSKYVNAYFQLTYRRKIKTRHSFGVAYNRSEVSDTIVALNSSYYNAGRKLIIYPELFYNLTYYDLDYIPYPTRGYAAMIVLEKRGLNNKVNLWHISVRGSGFWHLSPKTFISLNVYGGLKAPFKQPYFARQFLGYNETFLQGYEYNVIDGVAGGYIKSTLSHELLNFRVRIPPIKKGKEATRIPFRVFGKVYGNTGYVHNPQPGDNLLSNKILYSGGFGIDIITLYDVTFKLEYTFNQLGQNGLFLHRKSIF